MNFLVVGQGSAGQRHLRVLNNLFGDSANIYAYRGLHKRGLISQDLKFEDISMDPIEVYAAKEIMNYSDLNSTPWDLVIIATPPSSHFEYMKVLAPVSKRVLIEKPISVLEDDAKAIYELARTKQIPVLIGYQMAFHPLKKMIEGELPSLGQILSCTTIFKEDLSGMNPFRSMKDHHLSFPEGGGVFLSLSHDLEFLLSIFHQTFCKDPIFIDKTWAMNSVLTECVLKSSILTGSSHASMSNSFSFLPGQTQRFGEIVGVNARITWDLMRGSFVVYDNGNAVIRQESVMIEKDEMFSLQIQRILAMNDLEDFCIANLERSVFISEISSLARV